MATKTGADGRVVATSLLERRDLVESPNPLIYHSTSEEGRSVYLFLSIHRSRTHGGSEQTRRDEREGTGCAGLGDSDGESRASTIRWDFFVKLHRVTPRREDMRTIDAYRG